MITMPSGTQTVRGIVELDPADAGQLPIGFWSRVTIEEVRQILADFPGRSVWDPATGEFAVVSPWRHREDVAVIRDLSAVRRPNELLRAAIDSSVRRGAAAVIAVEWDEVRPPPFYQKAGFTLLEQVASYDLGRLDALPDRGQRLAFRAADLASRDDLDALLAIDHAAFPWIWWNSGAEFRSYTHSAGTEVLIGLLDGEPVSYLGLTAYLGWGHLDRIAVCPSLQGRGLGRETLAFAIDRLAATGARRIGLSTQASNVRSQRLYERFGFRRVPHHDYRIYGKVVSLPHGINSPTEPPPIGLAALT